MQNKARLVIIGAGITGASTAYHLAELGWRDVVVVEQGPLFRTGGSTSHAPGGMFQTNTSRMLFELARYSVHFYDGFEMDGVRGAMLLGGIELAQTEARFEELKRRRGLQQSWGLEGHILSPAECADKIPILDPSQVLGGLYVPTDGIGRPVVAVEAMARAAAAKGVAFHGGVTVTAIEKTGGRVSAVVTDQGRIETDLVLCCAGIWGPKVARLAGVPIPLQPLQHQYVKTHALPELAEASKGGTAEATIPLIRAQDHALYFRQHFDCWGLGNYRHAPLPVEAEELLAHGVAPRMPSIMAFTPEHFAECEAASKKLFPSLQRATYQDAFNGIFSFTPDSMPILGEHQDLPGFWVAEAIWVTHAGGVGRAMAQWLDSGDPGLDLKEGDVNRFQPHQATRRFVRARGEQQYREVYDIIHPAQQISEPRELRVTPVFERLKALQPHAIEVGGWERPSWYGANAHLVENLAIPRREGWAAIEWSPIIGAEAITTRAAAGLFDVSTFTKIEIMGSGALDFLQQVGASDFDKPAGSIIYTALLNLRGGVISDCVVARLEDDRFLMLTGSGSGLSDLAWLRLQARRLGFGTDRLRLVNVTNAYAGLGLWGPRARDILASVTDADVSNEGLPYYTTATAHLGYIPVRLFRLSYAGELGWEIYTDAGYGRALWDLLMEAGRPHGLIAAGVGALDTLRIEKGYRLAGADLHGDRTALEAGLGWSVALKKPSFIGRDAILAQKEKGAPSKLVCLALEDGGMALGKEPVLVDGRPVGYVTSANYGYGVRQHLAYAYLPRDLTAEGTEVAVEYFGRRQPARVARDPMFDPKGARLRS